MDLMHEAIYVAPYPLSLVFETIIKLSFNDKSNFIPSNFGAKFSLKMSKSAINELTL